MTDRLGKDLRIEPTAPFPDWMRALKSEAERLVAAGVIDQEVVTEGYYDRTDGWVEYHKDGYLPLEALNEDRSYWDA